DASTRPNTTADSTSTPVREPLDVALKMALAHIDRINRALGDANKHTTSAGLRFKEIKERVQSGEAGQGVSWADYCAANIPDLTQRAVEMYIKAAEKAGTSEERETSLELIEATNVVGRFPSVAVAMEWDTHSSAETRLHRETYEKEATERAQEARRK